MKSIQIHLLVVLCVLLGFSRCPYASTALSESEQSSIPGIEQLVRLDRLAEFHRSTFVGSVSSYDRTGGNDDGFGGKYSFVRKEGDALVLADLKGPGVIYRIWTPTPTDDWMEFYFDDEAAPRIRVRFRELFLGTHPAFPRPLVGYGAGGFYCYVPLPYEKSCKVLIQAPRVQFYQINYCYWPMPFDHQARLELALDRNTGTSLAIEAEVLFVPVPRKDNEGKFYAIWRRENPTTQGKPFTFIETQGRGHLVGCIQQSQGMASGSTTFFEGDDQTTIDGQLVIHGTGSEDFYNGGWYDVPGRWETSRSFPLNGCLAYQKHLTRTGGYRFMLGDAYAYDESILQTIEHAPTGNEQINDYVGTTFLYSEKRPTCELTLPSAANRRVVDLKRIVFAAWWNVPIPAFSFNNATLTKDVVKWEGQDVRFLSMRAQGNDWFGHHFISFTCELPAAGQYRISLDVIKGPAVGIVQLFQDEAPVGSAVDMYTAPQEKAQIQLGTLTLPEGKSNLLFKITGKNEKSSGLGLDLVNIICERIE